MLIFFTEEMKMFGEKLTKARQGKGLSQEQLAEKLFVTRQAVSRWENDKTEPDLQTVARICNILCVPPDYFIEIMTDEYRSFKSMKLIDKYALFFEFAKSHKLWYLFNSFLSVLLCGAAIAVGFGIISLINFYSVPTISILCGAIVLAALVITAEIFMRRYYSNAFNNWLRSEKNVIRTNKFI